jgi:transcriptional regulator GlxA family with amidase domain
MTIRLIDCRIERFGDVRAALKEANGPVMIRDIALEHGFAELGRFAAAYRRMWGELPRQTLQRAQRRRSK